MKDFSHAPGYLGYMILKEVGVSAVGSFQLKAKGIHETIIDLGEKNILKKEDLSQFKNNARELVEGDDLIKLTSLFDTTNDEFIKKLRNLELLD